MQGDASGGLDVTLLVAVAALAPARVEYSLDGRCPQQSVNPLGKRPLEQKHADVRRERPQNKV